MSAEPARRGPQTAAARSASRVAGALHAHGPRRLRTCLRAFWIRAYREGITGPAGMVAYNLMLALFPFALLVLFIFGQVLQSPTIEAQRARRPAAPLPRRRAGHAAERARPASASARRRSASLAAIGAIWIGTSFWGAMDTAFCRIYHVECRGWVEQKRFALGMLVVTVLFFAATRRDPDARGRDLSRAPTTSRSGSRRPRLPRQPRSCWSARSRSPS